MYENQLLPNYLRVKKYYGSVDLSCVLKLNGHASCVALGKIFSAPTHQPLICNTAQCVYHRTIPEP